MSIDSSSQIIQENVRNSDGKKIQANDLVQNVWQDSITGKVQIFKALIDGTEAEAVKDNSNL